MPEPFQPFRYPLLLNGKDVEIEVMISTGAAFNVYFKGERLKFITPTEATMIFAVNRSKLQARGYK